MSHVHWDHIMGFPFFVPAYVPADRIRIYGGHAMLEQALRRQQEAPSLPGGRSTRCKPRSSSCISKPGERYEIAGMTGRR